MAEQGFRFEEQGTAGGAGRSMFVDTLEWSRIVGKTRGKYLERFCVGIR